MSLQRTFSGGLAKILIQTVYGAIVKFPEFNQFSNLYSDYIGECRYFLGNTC